MAKKTDKLDNEISQAWAKLASGIQINMMAIPSIFRECRAAVAGGQTVEAAVTAAVAKYRLN